ncbi:MAG: Putative hydrolase, partial [uncultured Thermomicrobiales bacterium]
GCGSGAAGNDRRDHAGGGRRPARPARAPGVGLPGGPHQRHRCRAAGLARGRGDPDRPRRDGGDRAHPGRQGRRPDGAPPGRHGRPADRRGERGRLCLAHPRGDARLRPRRPHRDPAGDGAGALRAARRVRRHGQAALPAGGGDAARRRQADDRRRRPRRPGRRRRLRPPHQPGRPARHRRGPAGTGDGRRRPLPGGDPGQGRSRGPAPGLRRPDRRRRPDRGGVADAGCAGGRPDRVGGRLGLRLPRRRRLQRDPRHRRAARHGADLHRREPRPAGAADRRGGARRRGRAAGGGDRRVHPWLPSHGQRPGDDGTGEGGRNRGGWRRQGGRRAADDGGRGLQLLPGAGTRQLLLRRQSERGARPGLGSPPPAVRPRRGGNGGRHRGADADDAALPGGRRGRGV